MNVWALGCAARHAGEAVPLECRTAGLPPAVRVRRRRATPPEVGAPSLSQASAVDPAAFGPAGLRVRAALGRDSRATDHAWTSECVGFLAPARALVALARAVAAFAARRDLKPRSAALAGHVPAARTELRAVPRLEARSTLHAHDVEVGPRVPSHGYQISAA